MPVDYIFGGLVVLKQSRSSFLVIGIELAAQKIAGAIWELLSDTAQGCEGRIGGSVLRVTCDESGPKYVGTPARRHLSQRRRNITLIDSSPSRALLHTYNGNKNLLEPPKMNETMLTMSIAVFRRTSHLQASPRSESNERRWPRVEMEGKGY